jgi:tRNA-Thr(GGU) m(6)t(6)A37 methyltransferase TsaA
MSNQNSSISLQPIGVVKSEVRQSPSPAYDWSNIVSTIEIDSGLTEMLEGLEQFSHLIVLYWMHQTKTGQLPVKVHPRRNPELPLVGLLATRSPHRPNPIGKATVSLLKRSHNLLTVAGLDAIDDTPVLDIKPYIPGNDSVEGEVRRPDWATD